MAAVQLAVATAAGHFAAFDDASQEIYFTCTPYKMECQIEISPGSWAETLPSFSVIEVRKRSKRDSSTRAVREQAGVLSGPMQQPPSPVGWWKARFSIRSDILFVFALVAFWSFVRFQEFGFLHRTK